MNQKITKSKIDIVEWITCPYCKKLVFTAEPEMVGALLKWREQSNKKIKKWLKKKK